MRILFLSDIEIGSGSDGHHVYNGCGWIGTLIKKLSCYEDVQIGVSFFSRTSESKVLQENGVLFYINHDLHASKFSILTNLLSDRKKYDNKKLDITEHVIYEFNPDIIQVFGTENCFGLIAERVNIPVVIHLQGIINPCNNAFLPPGMSWVEYCKIGVSLKHRFLRMFDKRTWEYYGNREIEIFNANKFFIGRTAWDRVLMNTFNPNARYFECWEILRDSFYEERPVRKIASKLILTSTISNASYKGYDVILKTADVLRKYHKVDFEWHIFGGINSAFFENFTSISAKDNSVVLRGIATQDVIKEQILNSTAFVHLSYIDNSSNSVSEAMILGCPVIVSDVGGLRTLVENGNTGLVVPANDPYSTAFCIMQLYNDKEKAKEMGDEAMRCAGTRHNPHVISKKVIEIYKEILERNENI